MGTSFWLGIIIGFILSVAWWYITVRKLIPRIEVGGLRRIEIVGEAPKFRFTIDNAGHRHAVDVRVSCTLFSTGWASDPDNIIATVDLPTTLKTIDIMPGKAWPWSARKKILKLNKFGPRFVTFAPEQISEVQRCKLTDMERRGLDSGEIGLEDLFELGTDSFINVAIYGYDSFSGSRNVFTEYMITELPQH